MAPLALSGLTACATHGSDEEQVSSSTEEIIGGFPGRSARFNAVGALGFPIFIPPDVDPSDPDLDFRARPYVDPNQRVLEGETHFPFCSATLIAPNAVLTAEHCVEGLYGDEEFLIGFDGTKPARTVPILGAMSETTLEGGFVGLGSDVAVVILAEDVTDIEPLPYAQLDDTDVGKRFVGIGYGIRSNNQEAGQRYLGMMNLRGIGGNHAENVWGSYENFVDQYPELGWPYTPEEAYSIFELLDDYEASFGNAPGNAQACFGDSGGPMVRFAGGKLTVYGVTSGGVGSLDMICDWGAVYEIFGPVTKEFIDRSVACPFIPEEGTCNGLETAVRCAPPAEGGWEPVETDCSLLGLVCGQDEVGEIGCIPDPCEGLPEEGMCDGDVAVRCSLPEEGPRRVIETDCAILGGSCGVDDVGEIACIGVPEPVLSCEDNCGGSVVGDDGTVCFCDDVCQDLGDCCDDYVDVCEPGATGVSLPRP